MIGHVDADCFYVSAERVRYPHLRGMPVGVIGNHGACVIAKSYEMKSAGVKTGTPIWEAVPLCPNGVYMKRDFPWYEILTRKMLAIVNSISPTVEFYSIDEQFFVAPQPSLPFARQLQTDILHRVGVPVSVGIAPTKTLAKLISDSSKPFGCGVIANDADRRALLRDRSVEDVSGIARRTAQVLDDHGIQTCEQFADADRAFIRWLLTKRGEDLWWELNGDPVLPVLVTRPRHKFVSRGGSIGRASRDQARVTAFVARNVERLVEALAHYQLACEQLELVLSFRDAPERHQRVHLQGGSAELEVLRQAALWMLPRVWQPPQAAVHYMHVIAGHLQRYGQRQLSLFDQRTATNARIADVQERINLKIGRFALRSGLTAPLTDVHADPANDYDICDVHGKSCF